VLKAYFEFIRSEVQWVFYDKVSPYGPYQNRTVVSLNE
jgi:hypothetical protein